MSFNKFLNLINNSLPKITGQSFKAIVAIFRFVAFTALIFFPEWLTEIRLVAIAVKATLRLDKRIGMLTFLPAVLVLCIKCLIKD